MARIEYINDENGSFQEAHGSSNRLNVSARSDTRAYYNSRDVGSTYSLTFDHQTAAAGEFSVYWKNDSTSKELVIDTLEFNAAQNSRIKVHFVTGTATGGSAITPVNLNKSSSKDADATCRQGAAADAVAGITSDGVIEFSSVAASGHAVVDLKDRVRLGQGDAIAIEMDEGTSGDFWGTIFAYYE